MLAGRPYLNCVDPLLKRPALKAGLSSPPRAEYAEPMQLELIVELEAIVEDVVAVVEQGQATSRLVYELLGVSASFSFKLVRGLMHVEAEIVHARYGSPSQTNTGFGYVQFKQGELQSSLQYQDCSDAQEMEAGKEYGANFSVAGGPGGLIHSPLHESITLAALVSTGYNVASGTTLESASNADWEYIRGVVWNDDPACLLFNDYADANHTYSTAAMWTYYYTAGESEWKKDKSDKMQNPTGRSHYGDLQFLHCMASKLGEKPGETKTKVMKWLSVLWKLANGEEGITPDTVISKTDLAEFCPNFSLPANWGTLRYLLSGESAFEALDIPRRALGSMFHIIQDSYSLGHTRRTLLNPDAKISDDPLQFPSGVVDQWGPIENFHVYNGQDDHHHELYDHAFTPIPDPTNLANLDQFNSMIGCCDAVENCRGLIELKKAGKTWETGVKTYLDEVVFLLSKDATDADTRVWP